MNDTDVQQKVDEIIRRLTSIKPEGFLPQSEDDESPASRSQPILAGNTADLLGSELDTKASSAPTPVKGSPSKEPGNVGRGYASDTFGEVYGRMSNYYEKVYFDRLLHLLKQAKPVGDYCSVGVWLARRCMEWAKSLREDAKVDETNFGKLGEHAGCTLEYLAEVMGLWEPSLRDLTLPTIDEQMNNIAECESELNKKKPDWTGRWSRSVDDICSHVAFAFAYVVESQAILNIKRLQTFLTPAKCGEDTALEKRAHYTWLWMRWEFGQRMIEKWNRLFPDPPTNHKFVRHFRLGRPTFKPPGTTIYNLTIRGQWNLRDDDSQFPFRS